MFSTSPSSAATIAAALPWPLVVLALGIVIMFLISALTRDVGVLATVAREAVGGMLRAAGTVAVAVVVLIILIVVVFADHGGDDVATSSPPPTSGEPLPTSIPFEAGNG